MDKEEYCLYRLKDGQKIDLHVSGLAFDLLLLLIDNRPNYLSKDEILNSLWKDKSVEEGGINVQISILRKAIDDTDRKIIQNKPKRGYRFNSNVEEIESDQPNFIVKDVDEIELDQPDLTKKEDINPARPVSVTKAPVININWLIVVICIAAVFIIGYFVIKSFTSNNLANTNLANANVIPRNSSPIPKPTPCLTILVKDGIVSGNKDRVRASGNIPPDSYPWIFVSSLIPGSDKSWWANPMIYENGEWVSDAFFGDERKREQGKFSVIAVAVSKTDDTILQDWYKKEPKSGRLNYPAPVQGCASEVITVTNETSRCGFIWLIFCSLVALVLKKPLGRLIRIR